MCTVKGRTGVSLRLLGNAFIDTCAFGLFCKPLTLILVPPARDPPSRSVCMRVRLHESAFKEAAN